MCQRSSTIQREGYPHSGSSPDYLQKYVMEAAAKEFTAMVATIINGRMWMGSMGRSDLKLFEKPIEKPNE